MNIALIGAGQIGSRHLQALALLKEKATVQVMDLSRESLEIARNRFLEVAGIEDSAVSVTYVSSLSELNGEIDIAIVATGSGGRRKIIEELLAQKKVRYMILEKFLFSDNRDYAPVQELFLKKKVTAFVNCPRRIFPDYIKLKELLKEEKEMVFQACGSLWGLGCNGIHMLDLFCFLTGKGNPELSHDWIDREIIPSKRKDYVEFTGSVTGSNGRHKFQITSLPEGTAPLVISVYSGNYRIIIEESAGTMFFSSRDTQWKWEQQKFTMLYQSRLTNKVVEDLTSTGSCGLSTYEESSLLHLKFLNNLLAFIETTQHKKLTECLIT